jgi:hypothetical protein
MIIQCFKEERLVGIYFIYLRSKRVSVCGDMFGDSTGFAKDMETTISGIASILRKILKLISWYC